MEPVSFSITQIVLSILGAGGGILAVIKIVGWLRKADYALTDKVKIESLIEKEIQKLDDKLTTEIQYVDSELDKFKKLIFNKLDESKLRSEDNVERIVKLETYQTQHSQIIDKLSEKLSTEIGNLRNEIREDMRDIKSEIRAISKNS